MCSSFSCSLYQRIMQMTASFNYVFSIFSFLARLVVQKRCEDADTVTRSPRAFIANAEHGQRLATGLGFN